MFLPFLIDTGEDLLDLVSQLLVPLRLARTQSFQLLVPSVLARIQSFQLRTLGTRELEFE